MKHKGTFFLHKHNIIFAPKITANKPIILKYLVFKFPPKYPINIVT